MAGNTLSLSAWLEQMFLATMLLVINLLSYYVQLWGNKMIMPMMPMKDPSGLDG